MVTLLGHSVPMEMPSNPGASCNEASGKARLLGCSCWRIRMPSTSSDLTMMRHANNAALQMLEVAYLIYLGRYFYPVVVLSLFIAAATSLVVTLRRQRKKVLALVNECRLTPIVWDGWVRAVSSHRLLPGDVLVLQPGKALCDMVLLQGSCLIMESMLSGEVLALLQLYRDAACLGVFVFPTVCCGYRLLSTATWDAHCTSHPQVLACSRCSIFRAVSPIPCPIQICSQQFHAKTATTSVHAGITHSPNVQLGFIPRFFLLQVLGARQDCLILLVANMHWHHMFSLADLSNLCQVQIPRFVQAAQVRKSQYVPEKRVDYDPDRHHTCTVYAGTMVQQVAALQLPAYYLAASWWLPCTCLVTTLKVPAHSLPLGFC